MSDIDHLAETAHPTPPGGNEVDLSGRQLGNYRLFRRLGRGAMAEVYLAEQCSLKRQVAFKVLKSHLAQDETYVRRFHFEAQAAASLVHANIVQIHEVGQVDGVHFIAQEYVQGLNLNELMVRRGAPDLKMALGIMRQVARALDKAARHGIVHRDIKPENIMLATSGDVKVADFGLARVSSDDAAVQLTQVGFTMGTPLYMSPEQVEGKQLDPRSDIYSFGVTCYHMLAGEAPFRGETALSVAVQHLNSPAPRLENVRPDLPPALCRIVHKMLAKNPNERYASARELMRDLQTMQIDGALEMSEDLEGWSDEEFGPLADSRMMATQRLAAVMKTAALPTISRRRTWLATGGIVAACLLVGMGGAYATRQRPIISPAAQPVWAERKASADAQFMYAMLADTEQGWKSVAIYFPENKNLGNRANQQLARWYLAHDDYDQAMQLFGEFANMSSVEEQYRAFGLAGQAIVLSLQGRNQAAAEKLGELGELHNKLDPEMRMMVMQVMTKNQRENTRQTLERIKEDSPGTKSGRARSN